jgi:hypothetical protein
MALNVLAVINYIIAGIILIIMYAQYKSTRATTPVSQTVSEDEIIIPFSYNAPVDSHTNYKKDVVIVVEHPDERIAVGMVAR